MPVKLPGDFGWEGLNRPVTFSILLLTLYSQYDGGGTPQCGSSALPSKSSKNTDCPIAALGAHHSATSIESVGQNFVSFAPHFVRRQKGLS